MQAGWTEGGPTNWLSRQGCPIRHATLLVVAHTFFTTLACSSSNTFPLCELEGMLCAKMLRSATAFLSSARPLHLRQYSKERALGLARLANASCRRFWRLSSV